MPQIPAPDRPPLEPTTPLAPLIKVNGVVRLRVQRWIALDVPLICAADHTIRGTRHVTRGAHRCYNRPPQGRASGPECGSYMYAVSVRELRQRFTVEVTFDEIALLDAMSEAGILAHFRVAWPHAA